MDSNLTEIDPKKRYDKNPYLNLRVISSKKKSIVFGESSDVILNQDTGEIKSTTVSTFREVDDAMFIKLFTQNIGLTFNLSSYGVKALSVLIWAVQQKMGRDVMTLDKYTHQEFMEHHPELKMAHITFAKGLAELTKSQIIAKAKRKGDYFINPHFIFNGDRIRFVTEIRRKRPRRDPNTVDLISGKTDAEMDKE